MNRLNLHLSKSDLIIQADEERRECVFIGEASLAWDNIFGNLPYFDTFVKSYLSVRRR